MLRSSASLGEGLSSGPRGEEKPCKNVVLLVSSAAVQRDPSLGAFVLGEPEAAAMGSFHGAAARRRWRDIPVSNPRF